MLSIVSQARSVRATAAAAVAAIASGVLLTALDVALVDWLDGRTTSAAEFRDAMLIKNALGIVVLAICTFCVIRLALRRELRLLDREREAKTAFAVSQRRASVSTLAASVSHDLKNAMTTVMGNLEMLDASPALDSRSRRRAHAGLCGARETLALVRQLESVATSAKSADAQEVDVVQLIENVVEMACAHDDVRSAEVVAAHGVGVSGFMLRSGLLGSALLNLVINGAQAAGANARVEIRSYVDGPSMLRLEVHDNGPGIPTAVQAKIFTPYFTTKPNGTGLGLPGVRAALQELGGEVTVGTSDLGGARFTLSLPCRRRARAPVGDAA